MEDDKKKKRNKKKKNKQQSQQHQQHQQQEEEAKTTEEAANQTQRLDLSNGENSNITVVDLNAHPQENGTNAARLEDTIRQFRDANESHLQKEVTLQETIKQLQTENESRIQKEAALEEKIKQLRNENNSHIQKEVASEETINQLQSENDTHIQKEAELEEKISRLLGAKVSLGSKAASLEEKIKELEREKDSWILAEKTNKETIIGLNSDIKRLGMQVVVLEESRNKLLQENQQLLENISGLNLQLENLERSTSSALSSDQLTKLAYENKDLNSQIEAASVLLEKLITENAELVEKVNELFVELHGQRAKSVLSPASGTDSTMGIADIASAGPWSESSEIISLLGHETESMEDVPIKDEGIGGLNLNAKSGDETSDNAGIVQIPLNDNDYGDIESQAAESDIKDSVPLSDAPLIGAPFRFISFVAHYVSGADLVDKN